MLWTDTAGNSTTLLLIRSCRQPWLLGTSNAMGAPVKSLISAVRSCLLKRHDSSPEPIGNISDANAHENRPIGAMTKGTPEIMENMLSCLDEMTQNETSNPRRRENMQLCRDFVRDHGWPKDGYCIWALKGVVLVLTEEQVLKLPKSNPARVDAYTMVSRHKLVLFFYILFSRPFLMITTERPPHGSECRYVVLESTGPIYLTAPEHSTRTQHHTLLDGGGDDTQPFACEDGLG